MVHFLQHRFINISLIIRELTILIGLFWFFSALCKKIVADVQDSCMNLSCPSGNGIRTPSNIVKFNVKINLKDDTGYLIGCRLIGDIAERILGCTVDEFQVYH